ncbi:MAG: hypothetical protein PUA47_05935 [Bacteroidales bacterium]|nr:hypothetical protein [Bacteroidales bacterium]
MKRIAKYIGLALVASAFAAACNKNAEPVFDDKDAFVAFDKVALSVSEDYSVDGTEAGKIFKVPVTLASVKGFEETLKFEVTEPEKQGAKAGVNYELLTTAGVLSFDAEHRTSYIEFKTIPDNTFTGDLKLEIEIFGNEDIAVGSENICTLTINDIDHPLGFMLGDYTVTGEDNWDGVVDWTMTLSKDSKDITKVWIHNLANWDRAGVDFYGVVNADRTSINIPFGQECALTYNGDPIFLWGLTTEGMGYSSGSTEVKLVFDDSGKLTGLDFGDEWGFWVRTKAGANFCVVWPGIVAVKN